MENARRNLKTYSIAVLALTALALAQLILGFLKLNTADLAIPEGTPEVAVKIMSYVALVISALVLLPRVYVGVKGVLVANNPVAGKAHIIWGIILLVFCVITLISAITDAFNPGDVFDKILAISAAVLDVLIYAQYVRYAKIVANG